MRDDDALLRLLREHLARGTGPQTCTHTRACGRRAHASLRAATARATDAPRGAVSRSQGAKSAGANSAAIRFALLLAPDRDAFVERALRALAYDYGPVGFESAFQRRGAAPARMGELRITRCMYHDILAAEGAPALAGAACCALDREVAFGALDAARHGVRVEQMRCLAHGDDACVLTVREGTGGVLP